MKSQVILRTETQNLVSKAMAVFHEDESLILKVGEANFFFHRERVLRRNGKQQLLFEEHFLFAAFLRDWQTQQGQIEFASIYQLKKIGRHVFMDDDFQARTCFRELSDYAR